MSAQKQPSWSPDGSRIAFSNLVQVYMMNADGSAQTQLTNSSGFNRNPAWSPDGGQIAFQTDRDGNNEIYVMNADGSAPLNLTNNPASDEQPSWSHATSVCKDHGRQKGSAGPNDPDCHPEKDKTPDLAP